MSVLRVICIRTGKSTFGSYAEAIAAGRKCHPELRPYRCEFCHFHHLTSRPYDASRRAQHPAPEKR